MQQLISAPKILFFLSWLRKCLSALPLMLVEAKCLLCLLRKTMDMPDIRLVAEDA